MEQTRLKVLLGVLVTLSFLGWAVPMRAQVEIVHTVRSGENLFRIALYYDVTVDEIIAANHLDTVYVTVGQQLVIPGALNVAPPADPLTPPPEAEAPGEPTPVPTPAMADLDARSYRVQPGDTLTVVAARLGVAMWTLMLENGLPDAGILVAGQELVLPGAATRVPAPAATPTAAPAATSEPAPLSPAATASPDAPVAEEFPASAETYTVHRGDTLTQIAARAGKTVAEIAQLNGITNPSQIYVGQVLRLEGTAPIPTGAGKLIVVDLSEQHLYAFQGDQLVYSFVASTGAAPYTTRVGEFRIQSKFPNAYGSTWDIWMPNWLGIYWAGSTENGIHALPVMPGGQVLWAGYLGSPVSYGCIVLGTYEAQLLYEWAEIGTPVSIRY